MVHIDPKPIFFHQGLCHYDNVWCDPKTGDFYTAGHPRAYYYLKHSKSKNWSTPTASEVVKIPYNDGKYGLPQTVILSNGNDTDGHHISGSPSAIVWNGNEVIVGAVYVDGIMVCRGVQT